ncbi:MAG: restriction endonuclease [Endomicrobia bacterium]|nr:restriction endonuclease [Endomicrobiia bacterium]MDW8055292.1 restriction endonuclease [Elusimicrobiota bacterium]
MISYQEFIKILNKHVILQQKVDLLETLAENPERFIGLFRPTKPLGKILQHILQANEIKFGDAIEEILELIIKRLDYVILEKSIRAKDKKMTLKFDQCFKKNSLFYLIEQKLRDDHDSSKKRGQIENFEQKIDYLYKVYGKNLIAIFYFIDPELAKNKNYYESEINKLKEFYGINIYLFYGKELFSFLGIPEFWDKMLKWLKNWKDSLPELPEVNFDKNPEESFEEIKELELRYWRKILDNEKLWTEGIIKVIFPTGKTLKLLSKSFSELNLPAYKKIAGMLKDKLEKYF